MTLSRGVTNLAAGLNMTAFLVLANNLPAIKIDTEDVDNAKLSTLSDITT